MNANKPQHHLHHHSGGNGLSAASSTTSTASSSARPAYPSYGHYSTKRPTLYSGSNPYKPGSSSRPSSASASNLNSWEHESGGHAINGITNHLDSFFDADAPPPLDSAGVGAGPPPHEPLPNAQAFAVGNVLDLNAGEAADEYQSGGGGYHDASYRPVPGTKQSHNLSLSSLAPLQPTFL